MTVRGAGDIDADGYPDLLVGGRGQANHRYSRGLAKVYSGRFLAGNGGREIIYHLTGEQETDAFAFVNAIGDVNGDGHKDFLVGAAEHNRFPTGPGYVRVYSGRDCSILAEFTGANLGDRFGTWSSNIGDLDHDGVPDLVVGSSGYDGNTGNPDDNRGRAYIFLSSGPPAVSMPRGGADQVTANE